ncbi:helix-turn-helix transcriptional regulator [Aureimonas sp. AU4]|uniref:helix-turn-helix transcriptional regulator n=1 Tax=Aureimonas sp. AU4 TaxID=1638163 RepID=UPI0012E3B11B|nr:helix-turn-helix transcriptional regulator [Aureimonas sp. AU4]
MRKQLDETLDLIGDASADPALWREVTERVLGHTRAAAGAIYLQGPPANPFRQPTTEFGHMLNYGTGWIDSYFQHYVAGNPYVNRPELRVPGRVLTEADRPASLSAAEREFVADWQEAQGFQHVIAQFLQDRDDGTLTFVFWRDKAAGAASEEERAQFDILARAANRAVRAGDRLRQAAAEMLATTRSLDHLDVAVITLGRDGRVRGASRTAEALLAARDGLATRFGRLEAVHPPDQKALDHLVGHVLDPQAGFDAETRTIRLRRPEGRPSWRVSAVAVHRRLPAFALDQGVAAVITMRAPEPGAARAEVMAATFGLTPAELRLAMLLIEPVAFQEAAQRLNVSRETARSHLKALFAKTGTHGQTELVVRLLTGTTSWRC